MSPVLNYPDPNSTFVCARCRLPYVAGHRCPLPQGTALERGIERLRRGERLGYDERIAVLKALDG